MRGQRLFIRPIESDDHEAIAAFLQTEGMEHPVPACGLLGKLVGDLVAVVLIEIASDAVRVEQLVVKGEFRRKRIGRFMLEELDRFAAKMDRDRLVIANAARATEFLRHVGFVETADGMVRMVR
jgi:GNAT superfamily N-acetyltransferase